MATVHGRRWILGTGAAAIVAAALCLWPARGPDRSAEREGRAAARGPAAGPGRASPATPPLFVEGEEAHVLPARRTRLVVRLLGSQSGEYELALLRRSVDPRTGEVTDEARRFAGGPDRVDLGEVTVGEWWLRLEPAAGGAPRDRKLAFQAAREGPQSGVLERSWSVPDLVDLQVSLRLASGLSHQGAWLVLVDRMDGPLFSRRVRPLAPGEFAVRGLTPGRYWVQANAPGHRGQDFPVEVRATPSRQQARLTMTEDKR